MSDNYAKISFLASGHVVQDILITAPDLSAEELTNMLNNGTAVTTIHEGKEVCVTSGDWETIAEVIYVEPELDYEEFQLEDEYELPTPTPKTFDASHMALAGAVGEYVNEPDMSVKDILSQLECDQLAIPDLTINVEHEGKNGKEILNLIYQQAAGYKALMEVAHNAAKEGKVLI